VQPSTGGCPPPPDQLPLHKRGHVLSLVMVWPIMDSLYLLQRWRPGLLALFQCDKGYARQPEESVGDPPLCLVECLEREKQENIWLGAAEWIASSFCGKRGDWFVCYSFQNFLVPALFFFSFLLALGPLAAAPGRWLQRHGQWRHAVQSAF
jgi:hypothetical protein